MKIEFQDRIDDYLLDRMPEEERKSFELDAAKDAELKEQLQFTGTVQQATKSRNEKLAAMDEWKDDYVWKDDGMVSASAAEYRPTGSGYDYYPATTKESRRVAGSSPFKKIFYLVSSIAALFVVGFFLIHNLYVTKSPDEYMTLPRMNDVTFRAGSDNSDIESLLIQKKYDEALDLIEEKLFALKEDSLELVQDVAIEEERKEYELLIVKDKHDELKWLKAHAFLWLHRKDDALLLLDELRNAEGYYQLVADSMYYVLRK